MNKIIILAFALILIVGLASAEITGSETMTRTISSTNVKPSSTFTVTYTTQGVSGKWGVSVVDNVAGCQFPNGNTLKFVLLSDEDTKKTIQVTAPSSEGTCTFTGDYQFGTASLKTFSPLTITISSGDGGSFDWEKYKWWIIGGAGALVLLIFLRRKK